MFDLRFTIGLTDLIGSDPKDLIRKSNPMTWGPWWGFFSNTSILRDIGKGSAEKNCNFQTSQELQRSFCLKKICVQVIFLLSKNFRNTFCKGELVHIYIYMYIIYIYILCVWIKHHEPDLLSVCANMFNRVDPMIIWDLLIAFVEFWSNLEDQALVQHFWVDDFPFPQGGGIS